MSLQDYIEKEPEISVSLIQQKLDSAFIDVNAKLDFPPVAISMGSHQIGGFEYPTVYGSYGNFSAIVGASKSKKTFFKSLLVASYIGGNSNNYTTTIKGHRKNDLVVLDIDTEQGDWHAQNVFKRIGKITKLDYPNYKPFALRKFNHKERIEIIEFLIYESIFRDNIGLICIDGLADLVGDVNNLEECNEVVQKVMKWTDEKQFHLITIIHQNSFSQKATGHLGSAILKKAETICNLTASETGTNAKFTYTRGFPISEINFGVDSDGLPFVIGEQLSDIFEIKPEIKILPNNNFEDENNF
jgi:hypothetical protein